MEDTERYSILYLIELLTQWPYDLDPYSVSLYDLKQEPRWKIRRRLKKAWQYLHETQERFALPTFSEHYQRWRAKLLNGDVIEMPQLPSSKQANTKRKKASPDEKLEKLNALRDQFSIK